MTKFEKIKDQLARVPVNQKTKDLAIEFKALGFKYKYGWMVGDVSNDYYSMFLFEKEYSSSTIEVELVYHNTKNKAHFTVFTKLRNPTLGIYKKIHNKLMELYELN
jgi:hypothetical protein